MDMLARGEIDALVSMDSFGAHDRVIPVCKIGASDYYFALNKDRLDLLAELNNAMSAIQNEDPYYNQRMFDEYINVTKTNAFITPGLENWLSAHGPIRVGYWDDYLPFCGTDKLTGEFTGALKDYLAFTSNCLKNAHIQFEAVLYTSVSTAMTAMKNGKIDCVFPVNLSTYDSEAMGGADGQSHHENVYERADRSGRAVEHCAREPSHRSHRRGEHQLRNPDDG